MFWRLGLLAEIRPLTVTQWIELPVHPTITPAMFVLQVIDVGIESLVQVSALSDVISSAAASGLPVVLANSTRVSSLVSGRLIRQVFWKYSLIWGWELMFRVPRWQASFPWLVLDLG